MGARQDENQTAAPTTRLLESIHGPADLKALPIERLPELAQQIRDAICGQVAKTGGHLAPNLGVVELTIALHYVFDFGHDRLLFDVGHQCYPHKLLTGRLGLLSALRTGEGMAGFPEPDESEYDLFRVGHAGTSISTAVGMARADTLLKQGDRRVVALIGDGSIVNGVAMEGLNNAGTLNRQFLIVLNDNGMSIAKPQGALAASLDGFRMHPTYEDFKKRARKVLQHIPGGSILGQVYHRLGEMTKAAIAHEHMFKNFGLLCVGPVDGHDLEGLIGLLSEVKDIDRPMLLHVKTVKGKGFDFATGDPTAFHATKPFTLNGGQAQVTKKGGRSFTAAFADAMIDLMGRDEKVFAVTAAMPDGTGLDKVMQQFPGRTLDTGICESHAMDMCAGMAKAGIKPFFAVYSTFAHRAVDQVFQEVALQGLPVRVCMDRAGYVGGDGAVHHGFMDIAIFKVLPNVVLMAVSDEPNLVAALAFMQQHDAAATFVRYPRDNVAVPVQADVPPYELGKANLVKPAEGPAPDLAILAYGPMVYQALEALEELRPQGYEVALYDARFAKPIDVDLLRSLSAAKIPVLTVEDHMLVGGFGACVLEACNEQRIGTDRIHRLGMPQRWVHQETRANQLAQVGIDAAGIARKVREILDTNAPSPPPDGAIIHVDVEPKVAR
jgi:1-deoxy-D-xylulose-5-phosphate synthase